MTGAETAETEMPLKVAGGAPSIPPQAMGAAVSKLISATIGEIAVIFSRSGAHKHHTIADLEGMDLPAVLTGQVCRARAASLRACEQHKTNHVAEMMHKDHGARAPVAAVLWASVSEETDKRLSENPGQRPRIRPDEWKSGDQLWIIDLAGEPAAVAGSLKHLAATQFKDKQVKMLMRDPQTGEARVITLRELLKDAVVTEPMASHGAGGPR